MKADFPHPTPPPPGEDAAEGFSWIEHDECDDLGWRFGLQLPTGSTVVTLAEPPSEEGATATLALFHPGQHDDADVEILGHWLEYEVDPADWLEQQLAAAERRITSTRERSSAAGREGDALAIWEHEGEHFVGRFVTHRSGPRLFVVCCRSRATLYPRLQHDFARTAGSFHALHPNAALLAENVHTIDEERPLDWQVALPASWEVHQHPAVDEGAWFDAIHVAPAPENAQTGDGDGRLMMAVMTRSSALRARDASNTLLDALRSNDVAIASTDFDDEPATEPFLQAWYLVSPIQRYGANGELRCRVLMHKHLWVVAAALGPSREHDVAAWMRNKRALDLVTSTLQIGSPL